MASVNRYLARMIIPEFIQRGMRPAGIVRTLRRMGKGYRYQTMLNDIRDYRGRFEYGSAVRDWPDYEKVSPKIMSEVTLGVPRRYRVFGTTKFVNVETGAVQYRPTSWYTDTLHSKKGWSSEFQGAFAAKEQYSGWSIGETSIYAVEHFEGTTY